MIVGFGHKARVGKDSAADYLVRAYGYTKKSFAYPLKEGIGKGVFGLTDEQMDTGKEVIDPYWNMTPRQILQLAGTEGGRNIFGDTLWIKALYRDISQDLTKNYVITDVRYRNEAEAIQSWGGKVIRIDRDIIGTTAKHISEIDLADWHGWDGYIRNDASFDILYCQVKQTCFPQLEKS